MTPVASSHPVPWSRRRLLLTAGSCIGSGIVASGARALGAVAPPMPTDRPLLERTIPSGGESLPAVGLGTWRTFDVGRSADARRPLADVLARFAARGGKLVDSSPMYGAAEEVVGDLVQTLGLRDRLFVATKVWTEGATRGVEQMQRSRRLLRTPTLDLMQIHNLEDVDTHLPILRGWKEAGRIRYLGITHYHAGAHDAVARLLRRERVDFLQINYSPFEPEAERELLPLAAERGVAVIANRPFGSGRLRTLAPHPLPPWAEELGARSWAQLILLWILAHPAVTCAIPATSKATHAEENLDAARLPLPHAAQRRAIARFVA